MRTYLWAATFGGLILGLTGGAPAAVIIDVGVRFAGGATEMSIPPGGSTTLEVFVESADGISPKECLAILSASAAQAGAGNWISGISTEPVAGWTYSGCFMGPVENWTSWGSGPPTTELVLDSIVITHDGDPAHIGCWVIGLGPAMVDTIINIEEDPAADSRLKSGFESVTLCVPEPASLWLLTLAGLTAVRRRRP